MIDRLKEVYKKIIEPIVRRIQKVIAIILLTVLYFVGLGITWMFAWIFNRKMVKRDISTKDTYWEEAVGYEPDMENSFRQS